MAEAKNKWFTLRNDDDSGDAEMSIVGYIGNGWGETNYGDFAEGLKTLKNKGAIRCKVLINSGGGDMVEGLAMYDAARASGIKFDVRVIGMAASMASILMMIGDEMPMMSASAFTMFHKPQIGANGEAENLRSMADLADKFEKRIKDIITSRTGQDATVVDGWFKAGLPTWMSADEAVKNKVARGIVKDETATEAGQSPVPVENIANMSDKEVWLKIYNKIPSTNQTSMKLNAKNITDLGLTDSASETDINNAVAAIVKKNAELQAENKSIKDSQLADLKAQGEIIVNKAVADKKITAADAPQYLENYMKSPAFVANVLANMAPPTLPNNHIQAQNRGANGGGNGGGGNAPAFDISNRDTWTLDHWAKHDSRGLAAMKNTDREKFAALCRAAGIEPEWD